MIEITHKRWSTGWNSAGLVEHLVTPEHQWYIFRDASVVYWVGQSCNVLNRLRTHQIYDEIRRIAGITQFTVQILDRKDAYEITGWQGCLTRHEGPDYTAKGVREAIEWGLMECLRPCFNQQGPQYHELSGRSREEKVAIIRRRIEAARKAQQ